MTFKEGIEYYEEFLQDDAVSVEHKMEIQIAYCLSFEALEKCIVKMEQIYNLTHLTFDEIREYFDFLK